MKKYLKEFWCTIYYLDESKGLECLPGRFTTLKQAQRAAEEWLKMPHPEFADFVEIAQNYKEWIAPEFKGDRGSWRYGFETIDHFTGAESLTPADTTDKLTGTIASEQGDSYGNL